MNKLLSIEDIEEQGKNNQSKYHKIESKII